MYIDLLTMNSSLAALMQRIQTWQEIQVILRGSGQLCGYQLVNNFFIDILELELAQVRQYNILPAFLFD